MSAKQFDLVTEWQLDAPIERVWALLTQVDDWPQWWRAVKRVDLLEPGDGNGIGALRRMTWSTALPYQLTFCMRVTRFEPMSLIEGRASGELDGTGTWTLRPHAGRTIVRYDWRIEVTKPWMRVMAPVLRPVFTWNHGVVMGWGADDIRRKLGQT
jgi:uncharacterized protein YndB with AHSA1/START domain